MVMSSLKLLVFLQGCLLAAIVVSAQDFDFFYFVQQWPGSYCDTKKSCCYPTTGKPPSDFGIHGLWPNYNDGSYPSNCDPDNPFDQSKVADLVSKLQEDWATLACPSGNGLQFWEHEWDKHGTCSESILDQHAYFRTTLELKSKANLLQALHSDGINPNDDFYSLNDIKNSIKQAIGFTPGIECNTDTEGNNQLYQVYLCVDSLASGFIECPIFPRGKCDSKIEFPTF